METEKPIPLLYQDQRIVVCVKPSGVLSADLPQLLRIQTGESQGSYRTVHRLDQVVGGVMVLARSRKAAQILSAQVAAGEMGKTYLAVVQGNPPVSGTLKDLLYRDTAARRTLIVSAPGRDVKEAVLDYRTLAHAGDCTLVQVNLHTGRTHQIRAQFSSRGWPLLGDVKYGGREGTGFGLWSYRLSFRHPQSGEKLTFTCPPPDCWPWTLFPPQEGIT